MILQPMVADSCNHMRRVAFVAAVDYPAVHGMRAVLQMLEHVESVECVVIELS